MSAISLKRETSMHRPEVLLISLLFACVLPATGFAEDTPVAEPPVNSTFIDVANGNVDVSGDNVDISGIGGAPEGGSDEPLIPAEIPSLDITGFSTARLQQTGNSNSADIAQWGRGNDVVLDQVGDRNNATVAQAGIGNQLNLTQTGYGLSIGIRQRGVGAQISVRQSN